MVELILAHGKTILLVLLIVLFCGVLVYVFGDRRRGQRLERYGEIPFMDEPNGDHRADPKSPRIKENERREH